MISDNSSARADIDAQRSLEIHANCKSEGKYEIRFTPRNVAHAEVHNDHGCLSQELHANNVDRGECIRHPSSFEHLLMRLWAITITRMPRAEAFIACAIVVHHMHGGWGVCTHHYENQQNQHAVCSLRDAGTRRATSIRKSALQL